MTHPRDRRTTKKLTLTYTRRDKTSAFGRFGGGWQYVVGVQVAPKTVIVNLLVAYVRISWHKEA